MPDDPNTYRGAHAPSEADVARICDWWCDSAVEARLSIPEMRQAARDALNALRSAPVAERMEAMGMERAMSWRTPLIVTHREADYDQHDRECWVEVCNKERLALRKVTDAPQA